MGSELEVESAQFASRTYTDIFNSTFPFLLSVGMSYEDFWYKDPHIARYYIEAEKIRSERVNTEAWLQGFYIYEAIASFREILPALPKKGAKIYPYMKEPIDIDEANRKHKEEMRRKKKMEEMKQKFIDRIEEINSRKEVESNGRSN